MPEGDVGRVEAGPAGGGSGDGAQVSPHHQRLRCGPPSAKLSSCLLTLLAEMDTDAIPRRPDGLTGSGSPGSWAGAGSLAGTARRSRSDPADSTLVGAVEEYHQRRGTGCPAGTVTSLRNSARRRP